MEHHHISTPPPFTVAQKNNKTYFSTLTKLTIQRFTSMSVALGGVNCKFVLFGYEPFFCLVLVFSALSSPGILGIY